MNIQEMSRPKVIYELAKYTHHSLYDNLLEWKTDNLKRLLDYHTSNEEYFVEIGYTIHKVKDGEIIDGDLLEVSLCTS